MTSEFITALRGKQEEQQRRGGGSRASLLSPAAVYLLIGALLFGAVITMSPALVHRRECRRRRRRPAAALPSAALHVGPVLVPVAAAVRFYSASAEPPHSTLQGTTSRQSQSCCPAWVTQQRQLSSRRQQPWSRRQPCSRRRLSRNHRPWCVGGAFCLKPCCFCKHALPAAEPYVAFPHPVLHLSCLNCCAAHAELPT